jgi:hypothetical protein
VPRLSVLLVRASLLHLVAGFTWGGLILLAKGGVPLVWSWRLLPAHIELLILGWMAQLAMGVAFWILPRFAPAAPGQRAVRPRGDERPAWAAYVLLNAGVVLTAGAAVLALPAALQLAGRVAVALAVIAFARHAWPRVKAFGS